VLMARLYSNPIGICRMKAIMAVLFTDMPKMRHICDNMRARQTTHVELR
jgi:hypothetical protein